MKSNAAMKLCNLLPDSVKLLEEAALRRKGFKPVELQVCADDNCRM